MQEAEHIHRILSNGFDLKSDEVSYVPMGMFETAGKYLAWAKFILQDPKPDDLELWLSILGLIFDWGNAQLKTYLLEQNISDEDIACSSNVAIQRYFANTPLPIADLPLQPRDIVRCCGLATAFELMRFERFSQNALQDDNTPSTWTIDALGCLVIAADNFAEGQKQLQQFAYQIDMEQYKAHETDLRKSGALKKLENEKNRFKAAEDFAVQEAKKIWLLDPKKGINQVVDDLRTDFANTTGRLKGLGLNETPTVRRVKNWIATHAPAEARLPGRRKS